MQVVTVQLLQNLHLMCLAAGSGGNVVKPQMHLSGHFVHISDLYNFKLFPVYDLIPSGNFYNFYILHTSQNLVFQTTSVYCTYMHKLCDVCQ